MASPPATHAMLLTKTDIARVAHVQRPVVTMWIARYRGTNDPFPAPARPGRSGALYAAADVSQWVERHGLGNNPALRRDMAIFACVFEATALPVTTVFQGISALLVLRALLGIQLAALTANDILDEADELDPNDDFLVAELAGLTCELDYFAAYVDEAVDAAYNELRAFEFLAAQSVRLPGGESQPDALSPNGRRFLTALCVELSRTTGAAGRDLVDVDAVDGDLVRSVVDELPEDLIPQIYMPPSTGASSRLARRRLAIHARFRDGAVTELAATGDYNSVPRSALFITQPGVAESRTDEQVLTAAEDLLLNTADTQCGVIVGPASALCDPLPAGNCDLIRSDALRTGRVRCVVRMPEGLIRQRPGQSLGLWVIGSRQSESIADRWMVLGDVTGVELNGSNTELLCTDIRAAVGDRHAAVAHAFAHCRVANTAPILASSRSLPLQREPVPGRRDGADDVVHAESLIAAVNAVPAPGSLTLGVGYRESGRAVTRTIGDLLDSGAVRIVAGNRLAAADLDASNGLEILGPDELTGNVPRGARRIDRLLFAEKYPSARLTAPGDIVFCTSPQASAVVDMLGAMVVPAPARVLRITDRGAGTLAAHLIARTLSTIENDARPSGAIRRGRPLRQWRIPVVMPDDVRGVNEALRQVDERRSKALAYIASLDQLTRVLTEGLTAGSLDVQTTQEKE